MAYIPGDRLTLAQIARRWAAESPQASIREADILEELVLAARRGEFQFALAQEWHDEENRKPPNYDLRMAALIETCDAEGRIVSTTTIAHHERAHPGHTLGAVLYLSIEGLRKWCARPQFAEWARVRGLRPPAFLVGEAQSALTDGVETRSDGQLSAIAVAVQYRTGAPGRPTSIHLVMQEFERRTAAGLVRATLLEEAAELCEWVAVNHPGAPRLTIKTIKNRLRHAYRMKAPHR